jgi:hypothetical protein
MNVINVAEMEDLIVQDAMVLWSKFLTVEPVEVKAD